MTTRCCGFCELPFDSYKMLSDETCARRDDFIILTWVAAQAIKDLREVMDTLHIWSGGVQA